MNQKYSYLFFLKKSENSLIIEEKQRCRDFTYVVGSLDA
jgi:hypothetical protein